VVGGAVLRQAGLEVEHPVGAVRDRRGGRVDVEQVGDQRREDGEQHQQDDDPPTDDGELVLAEPLQGDLRRRPAGELLTFGSFLET